MVVIVKVVTQEHDVKNFVRHNPLQVVGVIISVKLLVIVVQMRVYHAGMIVEREKIILQIINANL